jgi:Tripartite tricarboxylate transporter family receptor/FG-GAP-like repeat
MKKLACRIALAVELLVVGPANAQIYPVRSVTIVVPYAAGGPTDVLARVLAERMRISLGQPVLVENVIGAGGAIGLGRVLRATPDGYTVSIGNWGTHVGLGAIYRLDFDLLKDFAPVALLPANPMLIVAKKDVPANDLKTLIAGGNHVWPGHAMSGPDSGQYPNMDFDATAEIARFFSIPVSVNRPPTATHDLNGDGRADILWRDTSGDTSVWFMNGTQVSSSVGISTVPITWSVVGTGDFNGDGIADIAWRDSSGNVAIWLMNGASVLATGGLGNVATSWSMVQTGDYNGDGMSDLFWRDTSGNIAMWFLNGTAVGSTGDIGNIPTNYWTVQSINAE